MPANSRWDLIRRLRVNWEGPSTGAKQTSKSVSNNIHTSNSMKILDTGCSQNEYEFTDRRTACSKLSV